MERFPGTGMTEARGTNQVHIGNYSPMTVNEIEIKNTNSRQKSKGRFMWTMTFSRKIFVFTEFEIECQI